MPLGWRPYSRSERRSLTFTATIVFILHPLAPVGRENVEGPSLGCILGACGPFSFPLLISAIREVVRCR